MHTRTRKEEGMTVCCVNDNKMIDLCSGEK